jgi:hypothetical protein
MEVCTIPWCHWILIIVCVFNYHTITHARGQHSRWKIRTGMHVCMYVYVCVCMYVCMYVCNLAMSSDVLLLLLFIFLGGKKSRIDRPIFLYYCRCPFYLVIYHLLLSRFVITIFLCVLVLGPSAAIQ